jgi:hypothetical protein
MSSVALPLGVFFAGLFLIVGKEDSLVSLPGELDRARKLCIEHISKLPKGSMIVFDFDDTLFDPNTIIGHVHSGSREFAYGERKALPLYKPIRQICDVLKYSSAAGMYITLITARPNTNLTKNIVMANFKNQHMKLHEYHANDHYPLLNNFKAILRKNITLVRPIGLTIGDQWTDVNDSDTYNWVKLPNQKDHILYTSL